MRDGGGAEEWREEARQPHDDDLLPLGGEDRRIELGTREERQDDRTRSGQKRHPRRGRAEGAAPYDDADDELSDRAHDDLGQRRRDLEPDGEQRRHERESKPHGGEKPDVLHSRLHQLRSASRRRPKKDPYRCCR